MADITYGLEIEFLTPIIQEGSADPDAATEISTSGPAQSRQVVEVPETDDPLAELGSWKVYRHLVELIKTVAPLGADMSFDARPAHSYKTWFVKEESTATEDSRMGPGQYLDWVNVEVTTPVFSTPLEREFRWSSELGEVVRLIRQSFRVRANRTCALHVHVGLRAPVSQGSSKSQRQDLYLCEKLVTLKKLGTLLWLAEDRIMSLCHPLRRVHGNRSWNISLSREAVLNQIVYKMPDLCQTRSQDYMECLGSVLDSAAAQSYDHNLAKKMAALWNARTWLQVVGFLQNPARHGKMVFDFRHLTSIGTIEFRPMEASFDEELLKHWTAVCTRLVWFANQDDNLQKFQTVIGNLLKSEAKYSVWDFLQDIGCPEQAAWFDKKCSRDEREFQKLKLHYTGILPDASPYYLSDDQSSFFPRDKSEPWDVDAI